MGQIFLTLLPWLVPQTLFIQLVWGRPSCFTYPVKLFCSVLKWLSPLLKSVLINFEAQCMLASWAPQMKSCKIKQSCSYIKRNLIMQSRCPGSTQIRFSTGKYHIPSTLSEFNVFHVTPHRKDYENPFNHYFLDNFFSFGLLITMENRSVNESLFFDSSIVSWHTASWPCTRPRWFVFG